MATDKQKIRAAGILVRYKNKDAVHFTSDGSPFVEEHQAKAHAKGLKDQTITTVTRDQVADVVPPKKEGAGNTIGEKKLAAMNLKELKAEVAKRDGLKVAGNAGRDAVLAAIEKFDAEKHAADEAAAKEEADKKAAEAAAAGGAVTEE